MTSDIYQLIKKSKADFVQVNLSDATLNKISFENGQIKDFSKIFSTGASVSVWVGKKYGIAASTIFSEELIEKAIKIAKCSKELEFFYGLPNKQKPALVKGLYGGEKTEEELVKSSECLIPELKKGESLSEANFEYSTGKQRVINSLGIDLEEEGSMLNSSVEYILKDKKVISYIDSFSSRKIPPNKEIENFSKRILDETRELKNPIKLKKFPKTVILSYNALSQLLNSAFISNFNGMNVFKKRSCLAGMEGKKIFSEKFSLADSGLLEGGIGSGGFDDEGSPSQENSLVDKGVIKNFIYDYNTAKHLNKKTTANSAEGGIGFSNILIGKGSGIKEDEALLVKEIIGAHTCNEITTEFSVKSMGALLLNKGQKKSVEDVMIQGKVTDILKKISSVGKEIRNVGAFYLPEIAFKGINIGNV